MRAATRFAGGFPRLTSACLHGVGLLSSFAEKRLRWRLECFPPLIEVRRAPSGKELPQKFVMNNRKPNDLIAWKVFGPNWGHEVEVARVFEDVLRLNRPGAFLDVGANTGLYSLLANSLGHTDIIALEPVPYVHALCQSNFDINNLVGTLLSAAASDRDGCAEICIPKYGHMAVETSGTLNPNVLETDVYDKVSISTLTIDNLCLGRDVACIKIDVEGFEESVIKGAMRTLERSKPFLFCEIFDPRLVGDLTSLGYRFEKLHHPNHSAEVSDYFFYA